MSVLSCAETRDLASELALGVLSGAERAEALAHVDSCGPCRTLVGELTDAADALPLLAPEAEPPAGFEGRVLGALGRRRRRAVRRWVSVVAATAAAATIVSVVLVRVLERDRPSSSPTAVSDVRSVPMIGGDGARVGWAFLSDGRPAAVGVSVSYGLPAGRYDVRLVRGERPALVAGVVEVADGHGAWSGTADVIDADVTAIALVAPDGTVVCRAVLTA